MIVQINIYTKCYDLNTQLLAGPEDQPMVQHYTLKYGDKELTWTEFQCMTLHRAKEVKLEYMLGQSQQTVTLII